MKKEFFLLLLIAGIQFTNILDFMVVMPLGPQFKRVFDLSPSEWSWVVSCYSLSAFTSSLISFFIIDRFDRRKFLLFIYGGFLLGTFLCGMASTFPLLILSRCFAGAFGGLIGATSLSIVGDLVPMERRGKAMGIVMGGFSAAAALGVPIGLYLGVKFGWNFPFFAICTVGLVIWIVTFFTLPSFRGHLNKTKSISFTQPLVSIFSDSNQVLALLFMVFLIFGQFTIIPFISPYMVANVGFTEFQLTYIYLIGGILTVFTSPLIGRISDKVGKKKTFTVLLFASLIPVYLITNLNQSGIVFALFTTSLFFVFIGGRIIPATATVLSTAPNHIRGTFMSLRSAFTQLGAGLAALISGMIMVEKPDGSFDNYEIVGYLAIFFGLMALLVFLRLKPKY